MTETITDPISREEIENLVKELIEKFIRQNETRIKELSIIERVIRVEEELKALKEIENARFEASEKRFETIIKLIEALQREMNARFEASDKRFEALQKEMNTRFETLQREMNARFEASDKRFEALQREMNTRFEALEKRFTFITWFIGAGFVFLSILITILNITARHP